MYTKWPASAEVYALRVLLVLSFHVRAETPSTLAATNLSLQAEDENAGQPKQQTGSIFKNMPAQRHFTDYVDGTVTLYCSMP